MLTKAFVLFVVMSSIVLNASAQDWSKARLDNSPRHLEWVKVQHDQRSVNSFIAYPEVHGKATAVVVIHEIFGLTDWARSVADELAEAGYIAIAPDLLTGLGPNGGGTDALGGADGARKVIGSLPPEQITADLNAVVDYVSKLPACNGKVVVVGFCWGGGQSFRFATNNHAIKAALVFYGPGPESADEVARIRCPIYGFYGGNDARIGETVPTTTELMKTAGKTFEPVMYDGAGQNNKHASKAPNTKPTDKAARAAAWQRELDILKML